MIITKQKMMQEIASKLNLYTSSIHLSIAGELYDVTRYSEDFLIKILDIIFDLCLENMNLIQSNYPSIDLGDSEKKTAFQITAERSARKVRKTLKKFDEHDLKEKFDKVFILFISAEACPKPNVNTSIDYETINMADLISKIQQLDSGKLQIINDYLSDALCEPKEREGLNIRLKSFTDYFSSINISDFTEYFEGEDETVKQHLNELYNQLHGLTKDERKLLFYIASKWNQKREESIKVPEEVLSSKYESSEIKKFIGNLRHCKFLEIDDDYEPYQDERYTRGYGIFFNGSFDYDILAPLYKYLDEKDFFDFIVNLNEKIIE